jgi:hypothetical protein
MLTLLSVSLMMTQQHATATNKKPENSDIVIYVAHVVDGVADVGQVGVALDVDDQLAVALGHVLEGGHVDHGVVPVAVAGDGDACEL